MVNKQKLVVEDQIITVMDIRKKLKNTGFNVPIVVSSEAIKKMEEMVLFVQFSVSDNRS